MAGELWWWPMSPWLSPGAAWFIFFNVVVGAIAVMSRGEQGGHAPKSQHKLARTASTVVMERLRSISIFCFHSAADYGLASSPASQLHHVQDQYCYTSQEQEAEDERLVSRVPPEPALVAGESGTTETTAPPSAPVATTAAAADAAEWASESEEEEEAEVEDDEESISLDEAYALARQSHAQARQSPPAADAATADTVARPGKWEPAKVAEVKRRAYACGRGAEVEGKAEVNARAELFIRQFREELKLQRLNSILNYTNALRHGPWRRSRTGTVAGASRARGSRRRSVPFV